eukprot:m.94564 g.94564  ORF g.94564 m.94564 type:complete len:121 (+) comp13451_c0_seq2:752-1114(+)
MKYIMQKVKTYITSGSTYEMFSGESDGEKKLGFKLTNTLWGLLQQYHDMVEEKEILDGEKRSIKKKKTEKDQVGREAMMRYANAMVTPKQKKRNKRIRDNNSKEDVVDDDDDDKCCCLIR